MRSDRRAFTLVELLVTIGILAVLIALLFPALSKAREHAHRVKCAANLRSIGQALTAYVQQHRSYPACYGSQGAIWPIRLRPYLNGNQDVFYCPSEDPRCKWEKTRPAGWRRADYIDVQLGYEVDEPIVGVKYTIVPGMYFSYGYNGRGSGPSNGLGFTAFQSIFRDGDTGQAGVSNKWSGYMEVAATWVRVPSEMIAVADSDADGINDAGISPLFPRGIMGSAVGSIHNGGCNVLFCDGHVGWHLQTDLMANNRPPLQDKPNLLKMWTLENRWDR